MTDGAQRMTGNMIRAAALLALAVVVAVIMTVELREPRENPVARAAQEPIVLLVEEKDATIQYNEPDGPPPARFTKPQEYMFPGERINWQYRGIDSDEPATLGALVDELKPKVVVLLNESFLLALESRRFPCSFVVPSALPKSSIERLYAEHRKRNEIAFISWYSVAHPKLIDHLAAIRAPRPLHRILAFFDSELVAAGVDGLFVETARRRHVDVVVRTYERFSDFERELRATVPEVNPDALFIPVTHAMVGRFEDAARLVAATGLPAAYSRRDQVREGGLIATDPPPSEIYDQIARYVFFVLHGVEASRLIVAEPSRLETTINLDAASAIGIELPYELLMEAAEIR